jgi:hypothetical protein
LSKSNVDSICNVIMNREFLAGCEATCNGPYGV